MENVITYSRESGNKEDSREDREYLMKSNERPILIKDSVAYAVLKTLTQWMTQIWKPGWKDVIDLTFEYLREFS